jgi:hypothetical protein
MSTAVKKVKKDKTLAICQTFKNKIRALARHVKNFPDDVQGTVQLDKLKKLGTLQKPRDKPKSPKWSHDAIRHATLAGLADIGQTPEDIRFAEMLKQKKEKQMAEGIGGAAPHKDKVRSKAKAKADRKPGLDKAKQLKSK